MNANLGTLDRIVRIVIGIVAAVLYFNGTLTGTLGIVVLVVGIVLFLTALVKFCPIYRVLGLSSCRK